MLNWFRHWHTHPSLAAKIQRWVWLITAAAYLALTAFNASTSGAANLEEVATAPGVAVGAARVFMDLLLVGLSLAVQPSATWLRRFALFTGFQQSFTFDPIGVITAVMLFTATRFSAEPLEENEPALPSAAIIGSMMFLGLASAIVFMAQSHWF